MLILYVYVICAGLLEEGTVMDAAFPSATVPFLYDFSPRALSSTYSTFSTQNIFANRYARTRTVLVGLKSSVFLVK
jgi:hypothetical protein